MLLVRLGFGTPLGAIPGAFTRAGFAVRLANSAEEALAETGCAVVIVAPDPSPLLDLLARLAPARQHLPVVCVTTAAVDEEIALLEAGASLCLGPDATGAEVMERTRHLLRLAGGLPRHPQLGDLDIDPGRRQANWRGEALTLRPAEFDLLLQLGQRAGRPVAAASLIASLWPGEAAKVAAGRLSVHLHHLRLVLAEAARRPLLHALPRGFHLLAVAPPTKARRTG